MFCGERPITRDCTLLGAVKAHAGPDEQLALSVEVDASAAALNVRAINIVTGQAYQVRRRGGAGARGGRQLRAGGARTRLRAA